MFDQHASIRRNSTATGCARTAVAVTVMSASANHVHGFVHDHGSPLRRKAASTGNSAIAAGMRSAVPANAAERRQSSAATICSRGPVWFDRSVATPMSQVVAVPKARHELLPHRQRSRTAHKLLGTTTLRRLVAHTSAATARAAMRIPNTVTPMVPYPNDGSRNGYGTHPSVAPRASTTAAQTNG